MHVTLCTEDSVSDLVARVVLLSREMVMSSSPDTWLKLCRGTANTDKASHVKSYVHDRVQVQG